MNELEQLEHDLTHLTIDQMMSLVQRSDYRTDRRFRVTGPTGSIEGTILDAGLGFLQFDGEEGFVMARDFRFVNDVTWQLI